MTDQSETKNEPELYGCYWCGEDYTEDDMYETGWNHDPMCHGCHDIEVAREQRTGKKYVWVGDKRYLIK